MAAIPHYYLQDKNSTETTSIILRWFLNGTRFVYSTRQSVKPNLWSANKERVLPRHPDAKAINSLLDTIDKAAKQAFADLVKEKGAASHSDLKHRLDIASGKIKGTNTFFNFIDQFIRDRATSPDFKKSTVEVYQQTKNKLQEFASHSGKQEFDFPEMDYHFFLRLKDYLQSEGHTNSYTKKVIARVKVFLNEATRQKINQFQDYKLAKVKIEDDESNEIYINKEELEKLYHLDLSGNERKERARDLFLIGAYTGLRFSDYSRLTTDHVKEIEGYPVIRIVAKKTKDELVIPLHPYVKSILAKYDGAAPKITDVELNRVIKQVGKESGLFDEKINFKRHEGGELQVRQVPRWEMIKTHTGRRSFATNAYLDGWSSIAIMKITGHNTETNFMKYIRVTKEQNAVAISKHEAYKLSPENAKVHELTVLAKQNAEKWGLTAKELEVLEGIRAKINKATTSSPLRIAK
ncbi:MAG: hypothetical protein DA408_14505 [Bacteroidetes bacterium]|nr:MAG: hypothetical protein DA408_14505 [Bacteroidota bacterium]